MVVRAAMSDIALEQEMKNTTLNPKGAQILSQRLQRKIKIMMMPWEG